MKQFRVDVGDRTTETIATRMSGKQSAAGQIIRGRLAKGVGQGKSFTRLDWARRQFIDKLGIDDGDWLKLEIR